MSAVGILASQSLCPHGLVTPLSWHLWRLYCACDGHKRVASPAEYYALPSVYVDAVTVIETEMSKLQVQHVD